MREHKTLTGVSIKDADQGLVSAVFATLNVVDADGDVTLPGAFEDGAEVRISAFGHASWGGALPIGKGRIREQGDEAILDGQIFLGTTHGRDHFETLKEMGSLMEWSYGFDILEASDGEHTSGEKVRFLRKLKVHEVSPVMLGAGVDTRTLAVKDLKRAIPPHSTAVSDAEWDGAAARANLRNDGSAAYYRSAFAWVDPDGDPETKTAYKFIHHEVDADGNVGAANIAACLTGIGVLNGGRQGTTIPEADRQGVWNHLARHLRDADREPPELRSKRLSFPDEAENVLGGIQALVSRVESWGSGSELKEGRVLSAANRERIAAVVEAMAEIDERLRKLLAESDPDKHRAEVRRELARYFALEAQLRR
jgi:phage head maturation protease